MPKPSAQLLSTIDSAAREASIDPALLRAVAFAESTFNPTARSSKGALGMFQLMPDTARELGVTDPFDPVQSARGAARYLRRLLKLYGGDVAQALAGYNWGMGNVKTAIERGTEYPRETRDYIARVLERATIERRALGGAAPPPLPSIQGSQLLSARCSRCGSTVSVGDADALRHAAAMLIEHARELESKGVPK